MRRVGFHREIRVICGVRTHVRLVSGVLTRVTVAPVRHQGAEWFWYFAVLITWVRRKVADAIEKIRCWSQKITRPPVAAFETAEIFGRVTIAPRVNLIYVVETEAVWSWQKCYSVVITFRLTFDVFRKVEDFHWVRRWFSFCSQLNLFF